MKIISGEKKGEIIEINNINELDVISTDVYQEGDQVLIMASESPEGEFYYQIIDRIRTPALMWLGILFAVVIVVVGKFKGVKALLGLALSFVVIMKFIIPQILAGHNPLIIGISGSFVILLLLIYITEGWNIVSHVSILSIFFSLMVTALLSIFFSSLAKLSGAGEEELMFLISTTSNPINFKGLLLTGIIIGTLGVLDDVVLSQVALVREIKMANPTFSARQVFKKAMRVGVTHIGAMTNTLFLAYTGASLPLLFLFSLHNPPFVTTFNAVNNELIATEIVRTLTGSIGLALSAPLATLLAVKFISVSAKKSNKWME